MNVLTALEQQMQRQSLGHLLTELTRQHTLLLDLQQRWERGETMVMRLETSSLTGPSVSRTVRIDQEDTAHLFAIPLLAELTHVVDQLNAVRKTLTLLDS